MAAKKMSFIVFLPVFTPFEVPLFEVTPFEVTPFEVTPFEATLFEDSF